MKAWRLGAAEYAEEPGFETEVGRLRARGVDYSFHATPDEAIRAGGPASRVEIVFATSRVRLERDWMARLPGLRRIVVVTSGYDNVDLAVAAEREIAVGRMPQIRTGAVVETTLSLVLALVRKTWRLACLMRAGGGDPWPRARSREAARLRDSTVGVVGQGEIGREVAAAFAPLARVLVTDVRPAEECWPAGFRDDHPGLDRCASWVGLDELLARSDVVTLHVDLNSTSRRLVRGETLALTKPGAILVNTSRGGVVDEEALVAFLDRLGGAALDVFAAEPLPPGHRLRSHPDVILLPHAAGSWRGMNEETTRAILEEVERYERGEPPLHPARPA